jgi:hypothetical protein
VAGAPSQLLFAELAIGARFQLGFGVPISLCLSRPVRRRNGER